MEPQQVVRDDLWGDGLVDGSPSTGEYDGVILHVAVKCWECPSRALVVAGV